MSLTDANTEKNTNTETNTNKESELMDQHYEQIVVLFNSSAKPQHLAYQGAQGFSLHPLQLASSDPLTASNGTAKNSVGANGFSVNKFSTAVFVKK
ncbi:hypothetical protein A9Q98_02075 [Thalassotalea sp. 42_200_T64]|nr:hypothetical protein A9Q98_02075 [Thalassotalea sp. 42_200_T64]